MNAMGATDPPWLPQVVGEVLRTGHISEALVGAISDWFWVTREEGGGAFLLELWSGRGLHAFPSYLASRVDRVPGLERLSLLGVNLEGTVHLLYSFFSIPVGPYSTDRRLLVFSGEIPTEGLPPVTDIPVTSFAVWHTVCDVPRDDHRVYVKGFPPSIWKTMPFKRAKKHTEDSQNLECQGLTFLPPYGSSCLLVKGDNTTETSCPPPPLLAIPAQPYNKALKWSSSSTLGIGLGPMWPWLLLNEYSTLSWRGGCSLHHISYGCKLYAPGPTPGGPYLQLAPLVLNTKFKCNRRRGRT